MPLTSGGSINHPSREADLHHQLGKGINFEMLLLMKTHWRDGAISSTFLSIKFVCAAKQLAAHISYNTWILKSRSIENKKVGSGLIGNTYCQQPDVPKENYVPIGNVCSGAWVHTCAPALLKTHQFPLLPPSLLLHSSEGIYQSNISSCCPLGTKFQSSIMGTGSEPKHKMTGLVF